MSRKLKTLGQHLLAARKAAEYTQADVGQLLGVDRISVWRWEHGQAMPSLPTLYAIADLYVVSPGDLLPKAL